VPKYVLTLIPLVLALLVGYLTYQATLASMDVPSDEQIKKAPVYEEKKRELRRRSPSPGLSPERLREALRRAQSDEAVEPVEAARKPSGVKRKGRKYVPEGGEWRSNLIAKRDNAHNRARKNGVVGGIIAGIIGYVGLFAYFVMLNRSKPKQTELLSIVVKQTWQQALQSSSAPVPLGEPTEEAPCPVEDVPPPQDAPHESSDEGVYEPYEPPVDISEIERAHDESQRSQPGENA